MSRRPRRYDWLKTKAPDPPIDEYHLNDGYYNPRPAPGMPKGCSDFVFWRWFDSLPPEVREVLNLVPRTGTEFQWLMNQAAQRYPLTDDMTRG